jgi:predicted RNA-binding Zn ribbon-like protein
MSTSKTTMRTFVFIGGQMCLDFANTLGGLRGGVTREYLSDYDDLVAWSQQAGSITENHATSLLLEADQHPSEAAAVLESARALREVIYRIFAAVATEIQPTKADLTVLNAELGNAMASGRVIPVANGFGWEWSSDQYALDQMFGPIARSAADLLTSRELGLVRECTSATCSWLFVDHTKNHRRRWCTMTGCGNVAKVRRHRQRQRGNEAARSS